MKDVVVIIIWLNRINANIPVNIPHPAIPKYKTIVGVIKRAALYISINANAPNALPTNQIPIFLNTDQSIPIIKAPTIDHPNIIHLVCFWISGFALNIIPMSHNKHKNPIIAGMINIVTLNTLNPKVIQNNPIIIAAIAKTM